MNPATLQLIFEFLDLSLNWLANRPKIQAAATARVALLKTLAQENRDPTPDEAAMLKQYNDDMDAEIQADAERARQAPPVT